MDITSFPDGRTEVVGDDGQLVIVWSSGGIQVAVSDDTDERDIRLGEHHARAIVEAYLAQRGQRAVRADCLAAVERAYRSRGGVMLSSDQMAAIEYWKQHTSDPTPTQEG